MSGAPPADRVPSPFADVLHQARIHPGAVAVHTRQRQISYAAFAADIDRVSRTLAAAGLPAGARLVLQMSSLYPRWLAMIAAARLGMCTVAYSAPAAGLVHADAILSDDPEKAQEHARVLHMTPAWYGPEAQALPAVQDRLLSPDTPSRFVITSGTTGRAKAIRLSAGQLRKRYTQTGPALGLGRNSRYLTLLGVNAIGGVQGPLASWHAGASVVLDFPSAAHKSAEIILTHRPTVIHASPNQLSGLLREWPRGRAPEGDLLIVSSGSALPATVSREIRMRVTSRLYTSYGATECSRMAIAFAAAADERPGYVGVAPSNAVVQVVDDENRILPAGEPGRVRAWSEGMASEYFEDPEATAVHFIDGWFYPGDLGSMDTGGGLTLLGRATEVINLGGVKLVPERIDEALSAVPGVKDLAVFSLPEEAADQLWIALVASEGFEERNLVAEYRRSFPGTPKPRIVLLEEIPRTEMGKPRRAELQLKIREGLKNGRLRRKEN